MAGINPQVEHLLRRAGFGMSADDRARYGDLSLSVVADQLVDFERQPDDVDSFIGQNAYLGVTTRGGQFSPNTVIDDARQRWLFRMVHTRRPLQEKMALFWHNHFATAYSKVAGVVGGVQATKMMANKPGELPGPPGQIELFRQRALGSFRDLLFEVARDPAMLVWLDGRLNTRQRPQENFGREIMELFTFGVGNYTEQDVYAAARVFTGWNINNPSRGSNNEADTVYEFIFNAAQHDATAKTFTFPIYGDGGRTIPARAAADGMQDGIDFITALARHPQTARRLAARLWSFLVSEVHAPEEGFIQNVASVYLQNNTEMRPVVRYILRSPWFTDPTRYFARYSWPVEFVIRAIKETGWNGFSADAARTPLTNMGLTLLEPPDVNGWDIGRGWFSTGAMLSRMNFASALASNQRFNLARDAGAFRASPDQFLGYLLDRFTVAPFDTVAYSELQGYLRSGGAWTGSDAQVSARAPGLARLIVGSSEYQFV
jgi:uncharacterized protein (DUF1800 family)